MRLKEGFISQSQGQVHGSPGNKGGGGNNAVGHTASGARLQREMKGCAPFTFTSYSVKDPSAWRSDVHTWVGPCISK